MNFKKFKYIEGYKYEKGWDKFAIDYSEMLKPNTVYSLTKEVMYNIIDKNKQLDASCDVLDVGCGTGNDFPFFLLKGVQVTAFDGSKGMLNKASDTYKNAINSKKINLYHGRLENLDDSIFNDKKFDLIYSITGGLAYIDDRELYRVFKVLKTMLKPNGKIITAHFNRFCLSEGLYNLFKLKISIVNQRHNEKIKVTIKDEHMIMHLRKVKALVKLFSIDFKEVKSYPLLAVTPPYQTGFNPSKTSLNFFKRMEMKALRMPYLAYISDQFVIVLSNDKKR